MAEPTLTINRQLAQEAAEYLRQHVHENEPSHEKVHLRIIEQYLALTDPEPLTAEHCREAGMIEDDVDGFHSVWMRNICDHVSVTFVDNSTQDRFITNSQPTRGDLRIATARRAPDEP